jgi:hypothetical protein
MGRLRDYGVCFGLLAVFLALWLLASCSHGGAAAEDSSSKDEMATSTDTTLDAPLLLPRSLAEGKLELVSLFPFSGLNPDNGGAEGVDIAAIQLRNVSSQHLTEATVTIRLTGGAEARFFVSDLPAGRTVMVFSDANIPLRAEEGAGDITCEASFETKTPLMVDYVSVSVEGMAVTVTNLTDRPLTDLFVHCHCLLGQDYFGGLTYTYPLDALPVGGVATVQALDCLLGATDVVRIGKADS